MGEALSYRIPLPMGDRLLNDRVIEIARSWIGTPYHHQASRKAVGCDCLGLVRGVYRELYGREAEKPPAYDPSWAEISFREDLLGAAERHLKRCDSPQPGGVIVFRMFDRSAAKHCAIAASATRMIHSYDPIGVCETELNDWWKRKAVGFFLFVER